MAFVRSHVAKIFYQTDGVSGSAGYLELGNVADATLNGETETVDITTRQSGGWRTQAATTRSLSLDFEMIYNPANAGFVAIESAWETGGHIGIKALDGGTETSGRGYVFDAIVSNFTREEQINGVLRVNVTLDATFIDTAPAKQAGT